MKWHDWDVAEDGLLSLYGRSVFPIYSITGHAGGTYMSYYLVDREKGLVQARESGELWTLKEPDKS
jgi:hypothetical protein